MGLNSDIELFEELLGIKICICSIGGEQTSRLAVAPRHIIHTSSFCSMMKSTAKGLSRCLECKERANFHAGVGDGFDGYCAFGLWECVMPIKTGDRVVGAVYAGALRDGSAKSENTLARATRICGIDSHRAREILPVAPDAEGIKAKARFAARAIVALAEKELAVLPVQPRNMYSPAVLEMLRRADTLISKTQSLESIAGEMGRSAKHLGKCFKREVGVSFSQYVSDKRLTRSAELLMRTGLSVIEIALECGFESAEYFTRSFKRRYGVAPTLYRAQNRPIKM